MNTQPVIFDGHNDLLTRLWLSSAEDPVHDFIYGTLPGHLDLKRCQKAGWMGGLFSIFLPPYAYVKNNHPDKLVNPSHSDFTPQEIIDICRAQLALAQQLQARSDGQIQICTSIAQIRACQKNQQLAIVLHLEGAEFLAIKPELLDVFYESGLRSIGPLWNRKSLFGDGLNASFPHSPDTGSGLTNQGKDLILSCRNKRMLIDVSHMNERAFWDTLEIADQPIVATHSNAHALCQQARNLTDRQLAAIKQSDGMVGVNFDVAFLRADGQRNTQTSLDVIVDHLAYLIDHLGEDHVGFGSDFDGCLLPDDLSDISRLEVLIERMQQRHFSDQLIEKVTSKNWFSVLNKIWH
ncbi:peptidase [Psychrobacter sp. CCUG 69069]|jgi:membrane dipeptidase|uniref:Dipeptidase n=1 Tax=Psychrobacter namhaensis TaxID=292734 RepID=A0ABW8L9Q1_9GAMM|nr:dipeptidase [Psychrobacter sp. CCUG 69069]MCD1279082.1 peptidase [Psychrobacter sp. CCUG 69069]